MKEDEIYQITFSEDTMTSSLHLARQKTSCYGDTSGFTLINQTSGPFQHMKWNVIETRVEEREPSPVHDDPTWYLEIINKVEMLIGEVNSDMDESGVELPQILDLVCQDADKRVVVE